MHKPTFFTTTGSFLLGLVIIFIFDRSLTLGDFHGLVFGLYGLYFSLLFLVVMTILAIIKRKHKDIVHAYMFSGIIPIIFLLLLFVFGSLS